MLNPGDGAFIRAPSPFTVTFTGSDPIATTSKAPCLGGCGLFSSQLFLPNPLAGFQDVAGFPPSDCYELQKHNAGFPFEPMGPPNFTVYTYASGTSTWTPSTPAVAPGESVIICHVLNCVPTCPGDLCATPIPVTIGSPAACGTTACATPSTGIPNSCGITAASPDVWYSFTPLCHGLVTIDTCGPPCTGQSGSFNTVLSVYKGTCTSLQPVICNNNDPAPLAGAGCSPQSRVTFTGNPAITYLIRVAGAGAANGEFRLNIAAPTPPPANDDCANAILVTIGSPAACGTTECATPSPAGTIPTPCVINSKLSPDVWYTFKPLCDGLVTISTCGPNICPGLPGTFNTVLSVYTGVCGSGSLTTVACNDNGGAGCGTQSSVTFPGTAGVEYRVRVAGINAASRGRFRLNVSSSVSTTPPPNDFCSSATAIGNGTWPFNTCLATTDGPTLTACPDAQKDVWFRYRPDCTTGGTYGQVWVDTCNSSFDTVLAVYSGVCGSGSFTLEACSDNAATGTGPCGGTQNSFVSFNATANTDYFIRVGGVSGANGAGRLTVQGPFPTAPACPSPSGQVSTRLFQMGAGIGNPWSWSIGVPCCANIENLNVTGVTTADPNVLAQAFAASINLACPNDVTAIALNSSAPPGLMQVFVKSCSSSAQSPFIFRVGPAGTLQQNQCVVADLGVGVPAPLPTAAPCFFNPAIRELPLAGHDLNTNNVDDAIDIMTGTSADVNDNGIPDESETCLSPQLATEPESQAVQLGTNVTFSVAVTGTAPLSYQWNLADVSLTNGGSVSGATSSVLSIQNVMLADLGNYTVTITNACGAITTFPATLSIETSAPAILRPSFIGGSFGFAFAGRMDVVYVIEYTDDLSSPSWIELETVTGYGQEHEFVDSQPLPNARFYRVRPLVP